VPGTFFIFFLPFQEYVIILIYIWEIYIMINIAIYSQFKEDRKIISGLLAEQEDFYITDIGVDGYDALRSATTLHPNIIIMDFILQDADSLNLAPVIKRKSPSTALIVLCSYDDRDAAARALKAGISGCLPRQGGFDDLVSSVRCVFYGGLYVNEAIRSHALNFMWDPEKNAFPESFYISQKLFSATEICIFHEIILGFSDKEIAKNLNITTNSLRNCVSHIKHKTGLHNRTQITVSALISGIVSPSAPTGNSAENSVNRQDDN
jgi:DNA-binding NarL/FixJ family response regulator